MIATAILEHGLMGFGLPPDPSGGPPRLEWREKSTANDVSKASTIIRQLFRDWSTGGKAEREACYTPVIRSLEAHIPPPRDDEPEAPRPKVLIPGCGLGRLVFEAAMAGYEAEGTEISYHSLLASSYILNHTTRRLQHALYPWILGFSNHISRADQLAEVLLPDVHPASELDEIDAGNRMSISTGDFCQVYRRPENRGAYDAVLTVFFIDTAPNFLRYLEAVSNCLRAGGIWINLGPLLWHFEAEPPRPKEGDKMSSEEHTLEEVGIAEAGGVELTDEEVIALVEGSGFEVLGHKVGGTETGYIQNPNSMLQSTYRVSHWIARKL